MKARTLEASLGFKAEDNDLIFPLRDLFIRESSILSIPSPRGLSVGKGTSVSLSFIHMSRFFWGALLCYNRSPVFMESYLAFILSFQGKELGHGIP